MGNYGSLIVVCSTYMAQVDVNILWIIDFFSRGLIMIIYETLLPVQRFIVQLLYGLVLLKVPDITNIILVLKVIS